MAAMENKGYKRSPYLKDPEVLSKVVKETIKPELDPVEHPKLWQCSEEALVCNYQDFLAAVASQVTTIIKLLATHLQIDLMII